MTAFVNARLIDPASGYDGPGAVLVKDGLIAEVIRGPSPAPSGMEIVDCGGQVLSPGLVDIRVKTGEPGNETKETLKSACLAAAAGGVTSIVVQPDTVPAADDPATIDFIVRRARDIGLVHVHAAGAATQGLGGERMAEIGLMHEAGALYVTDVDRVIADSKVMKRVLAYAKGFGILVAHRPADPYLSAGTAATDGELAARMGIPSVPAIAERIMLERDLALVELTGAALLIDQLTCADSLDRFGQAKARGLPVTATASINHLSFNEMDIGDYRTFAKVDPPLRAESDRVALAQAVASGLIDVITSAHAPAPAEDKRLPFDEAAPGAVGLQTFLPALVGLHLGHDIPLIDLLRAATLGPATLLKLPAGRLSKGAPADLVLFDVGSPYLLDADTLLSKSKNTPFDGRRLQGRVKMTVAGGKVVFRAS